MLVSNVSKGRRHRMVALAGLVIALGLGARPAAAVDFYAGKTVNFISGSDASGGFSLYARLMTRHLGRFIPGNPTLVFKTMPGAGSSIAANYFYRIAPKDGTTIGLVQPNAILGTLFVEPNERPYDPAKFRYLAGAERGTRVCMTMRGSRIATYADALAQRAVIGATAAGGPSRDYAAWHKATGAKFEIVTGYKGPGELFLAMERGEIDGICGLDWSALKAAKGDWLRDGKLNLLVQDGIEPDPELARLGAPLPWGFIKDDIDRKAVELMVSFQQAFSKAYLAPPDVPDAQVKILRDAFALMLRDRIFLAEAERMAIEISPQSGEDIERVVESLSTAPQNVVARLKEMMQ